jgi:hypothetical protein
MRNLFLGAASVALLMSAPVALADTTPAAQFDYGVYRSGDQPALDNVGLYVFGGQNYCWYDSGWQGPGYYWCGYAWRRGYGWGGAFGWNGWGGGHAGWGHGGWGGHGGHGSWGGHGGHGHWSGHGGHGGPHHH